ncbi:MAG: response regulator [Pleurocapsa sp.]
MNNNVSEPYALLEEKSAQGWSGCIEVTEPQDISVIWQVYLFQGQIQYATSKVGQQERLNYLWQEFKLGENCPRLTRKNSDYRELYQWLSDKQLDDSEIKEYLFQFTKEAINQIVTLKKASIKLIPNESLSNTITEFNFNLFKPDEQRRKVQQLRIYLASPFSRLSLEQKNSLHFYKFWKNIYDQPEFNALAKSLKLANFVSLFVTKSSFYEIANQVNVDCILVAKYLKESIDKNILNSVPFAHNYWNIAKSKIDSQDSQPNNRISAQNKSSVINTTKNINNPLVVCIDDSKTVQKQIKMTLEAVGYEVMGITDPTQAFKELSVLKPILILMDINMPNINGYDLCSMLRKSQKFKVIPIVMLTGRDGMIDRMRAKLVGSTDYLTKPCNPNQLIELVRKLNPAAATVS